VTITEPRPTPVGARRTAPLGSAARRLLEVVTTPLLPQDYLDLVDPVRSGAALRARIEAVHQETPQAATLVLRPGRTWRGHVPGQYVRIGVDVDGVRRWRAYSLTSGPRDDGRIAITVKVIPDGVVSTHLVRRARPGDVVQLDQATGAFHLPAIPPARVLFVTAGSGITPVMGMLRHSAPALADAVLVHSAPTAPDVIFGAELSARAAAGQLRLLERHTERVGLLTPEVLARSVPDWAQRETWACGPPAMLDTLQVHWAQHGVADRLHTERFRAQVVVTGSGGPVTFTRTGRTVEADGATPLLDVGEAAGVLLPSGCRMGICMGCVRPLAAGAVRDLRTGAITTAEPGDGVSVQTCVTAAAGPCSIDE
jgi:stearoyl-CoA 9-desaturase NADPH oxidoreductase